MTGTGTPKMYFEKGLVHCEGAGGNDYALCGFTLDGATESTGRKITCGDCIRVIKFCRSLRRSVIHEPRRR